MAGANINRRGKMPVFLTGSVAVKIPKGFLTETLSSNTQVKRRPLFNSIVSVGTIPLAKSDFGKFANAINRKFDNS